MRAASFAAIYEANVERPLPLAQTGGIQSQTARPLSDGGTENDNYSVSADSGRR
jgi:hypothetical protein